MNKERLISAVAILVIGVGAFIGGMQYQKHTGTSTTASNSRFGGQSGTGGFGGTRANRGAFGTLTAINGSTLTVTSNRGTATTYTVNTSSSTTYTDASGNATTAASLATGDTIIAQGTTSGTTVTATSIRINPSFGGGAGAPGGAPDDQSGSQTN